ncbi:MAG: asparagine synthase (glutamine-hydrolyzing) [Pseudomonadota bacterium]
MCGICGIWKPGSNAEALIRSVGEMNAPLAHRGPDDSGLWHDPKAGVGFGHRRLSILDLSPLGHQPMISESGRYVLTYNGEVYNYRELRSELESLGHAFRGGSDTEVMLAAFTQWGLEQSVERFVGMFAFALWDSQDRRLHLVRDRLGIKPLYYGHTPQGLAFSSELKSFRSLLGHGPAIDINALSLFFRFNYVPTPFSIYEGISKLPPGSIASFFKADAAPAISRYWSAHEVWRKGAEAPFQGSAQDAARTLEALLEQSVRLRMLADVPVGAFLSGGVDSTVVTALMQRHSSRPVKTFTIGFKGSELNEADFARTVAAHLGTDHTEHYLSPKELLETIPDIPRYWDEPFADPSQVPTFCISRLARQQVTVALSGDGGDELFAGYSRYFNTNMWAKTSRVPRSVRSLAARLRKLLPARIFKASGHHVFKLHWRLDLLACESFGQFYRDAMSHQLHPEDLVLNGTDPATQYTDPGSLVSGGEVRQMAFWDLTGYLPDGILTKLDRASMAVSLECRVPFLDHRVVEFAARLPEAMQTDERGGKSVLRQVLNGLVPRPLIDRPKAGFDMPIDTWLRHELRDWAESLISENRLRSEGMLNPKTVRGIWDDHIHDRVSRPYALWGILMFQAWLHSIRNLD